MAAQWDLVIRGGSVFDGSADGPLRADLAIKGDRIAAVGTIAGNGAAELDARGLRSRPASSTFTAMTTGRSSSRRRWISR